MDNYKVYLLTFPNGKQYVGMTKQKLNRRWKNGYGYETNKEMNNAIQEFGWENIKKEVLHFGLSKDEACNLEKYYIKTLNTKTVGYNKAEGGESAARITFEYNGKECSSHNLEKIAKDGITSHDITTRLGRGWNINRALTQPKCKKVYEYEYCGKTYSIDGLYMMCVANITRDAFLNRLQRGWDIERALTWEQGKKLQPYTNLYEYNGEHYNIKELLQLSDVDGLTEAILRDRLNNKHWSVEKAINQPLKKRNKIFEYNGAVYTSKQLAQLSPYNITHHHITDRIAAGWSIEKTIMTPINKK